MMLQIRVLKKWEDRYVKWLDFEREIDLLNYLCFSDNLRCRIHGLVDITDTDKEIIYKRMGVN